MFSGDPVLLLFEKVERHGSRQMRLKQPASLGFEIEKPLSLPPCP